MDSVDRTSQTLLDRVRDQADEEAWDEFYHFYSRLILRFARSRGCNEAMARDVHQETMVKLFNQMPAFEYNPDAGRFRSYLFRIVNARVVDAFRREARYMCYSSLDAGKLAEPMPELIDEPVAQQHECWDREWNSSLLALALKRVARKVDADTYRSFEQYVINQRDAAEVAAEMGLAANAVYQHKNRLLKMLKQEVAGLEEELGT